jgi:hypothetical protein
MKTALALCLAASLAVSAHAAEPADAGNRLTVGEALGALAALRNLDGRQVVVKQGESSTIVLQSWEFKNGTLRMIIADDLKVLSTVEASAEAAKQAIVKDVFKGQQPKDGTPEMAEFSKQYGELLKAPANIPGIAKIDRKDLRLDVNEIGVTVLQALDPILLR